MKAQVLINSNFDFWFNLNRDPKFKELIHEYSTKPNSLLKYHQVLSKPDKYLCSFHSHSDGNSLRDIAERASGIGYKLFAVTDHLATYKTLESKSEFDESGLIYFDEFGKDREIYLMRGLECHCLDNGKEIKLLLLGYRNPDIGEKSIEAGLSLEETIERTKILNGLVMTTSTFNKDSKGIDYARLVKNMDNIDAIGILDSACGLLGNKLTKLYVSDIRAAKFAQEKNMAGFYELNSHTLESIGSVGVYIPERDLISLARPSEVIANPQILTDELRTVLKRGYGALENEGGYFPALAPLFSGKMGKIILEDLTDANFRHLKNFLKYLGSFLKNKN